MSSEEHLYENILTLVQMHGAYHFTAADAERIKSENMVPEVGCASVEAIGHLVGMANYVVYNETMYPEAANPFGEQNFDHSIIHCGIKRDKA